MIEQGVRSHEAGAVRERQTLVVEVAVYRTGRVYRAICLDLSLIVERPTLSAAYTELIQVMHDYVADALDAGCEMRDVLRPVQPSERRYIYFRLALSAIRQLVASFYGFGRRSDNRPTPEGFTRSFCSI